MFGCCALLGALLVVSLSAMVATETCPSAGAPGLPGIPGFPGRDGRGGLKGEKGSAGMPLRPGQGGEKEEKGEAGIKGGLGKPGRSGEAGERGPPGHTGTQGDRGESGTTNSVLQSAFSVRRMTSIKPERNIPVRFTSVITNINGHYSVDTGKFMCHIPGTYYFVYHTSSYESPLCVILMLQQAPSDPARKLASFCDLSYNTQQVSSGGLAVYLKKDQEVWLQTNDHNGMYAEGGKGDSVFSGFLVYAH